MPPLMGQMLLIRRGRNLVNAFITLLGGGTKQCSVGRIKRKKSRALPPPPIQTRLAANLRTVANWLANLNAESQSRPSGGSGINKQGFLMRRFTRAAPPSKRSPSSKLCNAGHFNGACFWGTLSPEWKWKQSPVTLD